VNRIAELKKQTQLGHFCFFSVKFSEHMHNKGIIKSEFWIAFRVPAAFHLLKAPIHAFTGAL